MKFFIANLSNIVDKYNKKAGEINVADDSIYIHRSVCHLFSQSVGVLGDKLRFDEIH